MRDYGKISAKFWTGGTGKSIRGHHEAQIVALYLMTCTMSEMTGVFQIPKLYIAHETGLGMEGASKGLLRLVEMNFCMYDEDSETVFVYEMAKFQIGEELKVNDNQVKAVQKAFSSMAGEFKSAFFERYSSAFHLTLASPLQAPPKPRTGTRADTGSGTDSVPNGTGGEPPIEKSPEELAKTELWRAGKSLLLEQGMHKDQCGTFVGKLCKDYGDEIVIEAVRSAVVKQPADAASFLKAACMAAKKEGGKTLIPWHATDEGVAEKGLSLDPPLRALPGESAKDFKIRIVRAVDNGGTAPVVASSAVSTLPVTGKSEKPAGMPDLKSLVRTRETA